VRVVASADAGAIGVSGYRRTRTVAMAKLVAITSAKRSPTIVPREYEADTMITAPASATPIVSHVRGATGSPSQSQPSRPPTQGPVEGRISGVAAEGSAT